MSVSGFLIIDKPHGVTSFSMVAMVRRLTGVKRVGHAGTLDPLATGVLPIAIGQATRLIEYTDDSAKTYLARARLGVATDTYDAEGQVTGTGDASQLTADAVSGALAGFVGDVAQTPPAYSAIKVAGKPLYRYAREGAAVEAAARTVSIESIELIDFGGGLTDPRPGTVDAELRVVCGKGTYIRSLAHDLGQRLGCGAHLAALRRTSSAGFDIAEGHTPDVVTAAAADETLHELILAPDRAVERRPAAIFDEPRSRDLLAGRDLSLDAGSAPAICRAYATSGAFLGVLRNLGEGRWHPEKVVFGT